MRVLLLTVVLAVLVSGAPRRAGIIPEYGYQVVRVFPHDSKAFTEGLFYLDGFLYESTGLRGRSSLRKVKLETGEILQERDLPEAYFGEGIVAWKNRLIQLTYTTQTGFVYQRGTFLLRRTFQYPGEGWSITQDGKHLLMDDGTPEIRIWDPETFQEVGRIRVTAGGKPVENLNELEWVHGEIYANIWHSDRIARINPANGKVVGWIDLSGLLPQNDLLPEPEGSEQVLNGIAYDAQRNRLFVTGKYWPKLFEIRLKRK